MNDIRYKTKCSSQECIYRNECWRNSLVDFAKDKEKDFLEEELCHNGNDYMYRK